MKNKHYKGNHCKGSSYVALAAYTEPCNNMESSYFVCFSDVPAVVN